MNVKRKAVSEILLTLLLMSFLTPIFNIQPVEAETTPLINPVPGQYANYTMYFQNGTTYGWCLVTYQSYETPILVNVSTEVNVSTDDIYGESWLLVNVMNRIMFEGTNVTWSFWIETDIKLDDEIILESFLAKVVDSGIIDAAGFTREYWILEATYPSMNITYLYGFDKETGILIYLKTFFPEGETNFLLTSTNIFTSHIGNVLYWIEGMADWENLEAYPTPAKVGDDIHLKVYWWNDGSAAAVGNVTAQPTAPSYKYYVPDAVQEQNISINPGSYAAAQFDPVNLNESGSWTFLGRLDLDDVDWIDYKQIPFAVESDEKPETESKHEVEVGENVDIVLEEETESEEELEPSILGNIPGFPYESIILGLIAVIIIIWRARNL